MPPARNALVYAPEFVNPAPNPPKRRRRSGNSTALVKAKASAARANKRARNIKDKVSSQGVVMIAGGFVTGAALGGVLEGTFDFDILGIDSRLFVGAALVLGSAFMIKDPWTSLFVGSAGLGVAAGAISAEVEDLMSSLFNS
jgi:hypothetical protein